MTDSDPQLIRHATIDDLDAVAAMAVALNILREGVSLVWRSSQGLMDEATIFSASPGEQAALWLEQGARRLHIVELNGAFAGKQKNERAIKASVDALDGEIPIQLGGGIRDLDTIARCLDNGVDYVIIGTAAVKNPGFLKDACTALYGPILASPDAKVR